MGSCLFSLVKEGDDSPQHGLDDKSVFSSNLKLVDGSLVRKKLSINLPTFPSPERE